MNIRLEEMSGKSTTINVNKSQLVGDIIEENNLSFNDSFKILLIHKGKILNNEITLGYYEINEGDKIIVFRKKIVSHNTVLEESESKITDDSKQNPKKFAAKMRKMEIMERIKAEDRFFQNWESSRMLPKILNESMKIIKQREQAEETASQTIIPEKPFLSTNRLPLFDDYPLPNTQLRHRSKEIPVRIE
ncbi:hypothetical protein TVAG_252960 [Trichomonas vaginalis G3]|uniref:Ubiquitin-like domain-containing protein n=1 Tax=Trichomonas vaginalis (strain ATCC PRA-98 / G3) TaxID=412133 RepID=A2EXF5_TRIV3|nr:ubiquitin-like family [Trichomonas vaginalis G3]EAY02645.1 hypothetical protein TVAG_252960 [Trichomonas vaginalis G3]KAI5550142.1 ubiquitin-like family [Trichomonas vaginalis G3]|eukprot:XP_001314868.1 hypothetical protein [Trichomonas vaginalis G3]